MKRINLLATALALLVAACAEPANENWMLGVFSSRKPGSSFDGSFELYRIEEGGEVTYEFNPPFGYSRARRWERRGRSAIMMFPGPDDDEFTTEHYTWKITRAGRCGPYEFDSYSDGEDLIPGSSGHVYPGEICVRENPSPCDGECDCCELYWCEAPPPCD